MSKTALLFGSIGSIVETSDIQRRAYNQALTEAGMSWNWDRDTYADLLEQAGGRERLAHLSAATHAGLTPERIEAIHERKTELACAEIASRKVPLRPGVADLVKLAKSRGLKVGFVTTTYKPNIDAIFEAAGDTLRREDFDVIVSRDDVRRGKPAPDAYETALEKLAIAPTDALAIEDTATSVMSAKRAGLTVVATPGEITAGQDFWQADVVVPSLTGNDGALDRSVVALLER
jgi:HAD superfamily hydrolase (TIGR01509 family)